MGRPCKCRYCQTNTDTQNAYLHMFGKQKAFFCNEEHYNLFIFEKEEAQRRKQEELEIERQKKRAEIEAERKKKQEELELARQKKLQELEEFEAAKAKKKEEIAAERKKKQEEHDLAVEQRKEEKNKVYYLICEIVGRKEIVNTLLWKEWKEWNKVATNAVIGEYLETNKRYLCDVVSRIEDKEFLKIKYLSAILKNSLGDYRSGVISYKKITETVTPKIQDEHYETKFKLKKRVALDDLEDGDDE